MMRSYLSLAKTMPSSATALLRQARRDISYRVQVCTGDYRSAGTEANVSLQLFGTRGKSPKLELTEEDLLHSVETSKQGSHSVEWRRQGEKDEISSNGATKETINVSQRPSLCKRNTTQTFSFEVPKEVGELHSIQIEHDGVGSGAGWYLEKVVVKSDDVAVDDDETPKIASFRCYKWLGQADSGVGISGPEVRVLLRDSAGVIKARETSLSALTMGGPGLKLCTSAVAVPHADKVRNGARGVNKRSFGHAGDDAYFVAGEKAIGVADGVGQWREKGIDSGEFSRALMKASLMYATSSFSERKSASSLLVSAAANVSAEKTLGSSTACVLTLDQSTGEFDYFFNSFMIVYYFSSLHESHRCGPLFFLFFGIFLLIYFAPLVSFFTMHSPLVNSQQQTTTTNNQQQQTTTISCS